jgi:hypothetical protein
MMCIFNWLVSKYKKMLRNKKINTNLLWPAVPDAASNFSPASIMHSAGESWSCSAGTLTTVSP